MTADGPRRSLAATTDCAEVRPRGATSSPRSGEATERSNPLSKEQRLHGSRKAKGSYSTFKIRRGAIRR